MKIFYIIMLLLITISVYAIDMIDRTKTFDYINKQIIYVSKIKSLDSNNNAFYVDYRNKLSLDQLMEYTKIENETNINEYSIYTYKINSPQLDIKHFLYFEPINNGKSNEYLITKVIKDDNIIWDRFYRNDAKDFKIFDIKSIDDMDLILYTDSWTLYLNYVYNKNKKIYVEYALPHTLQSGKISGTKKTYSLKNAKIISTNIIKMEFEDGREEYWIIKKMSKKIKTKSNLEEIYPIYDIVLWSNNIGKDCIRLDSYKKENYLDQDTEPTIEQLKEKFPNDTFF